MQKLGGFGSNFDANTQLATHNMKLRPEWIAEGAFTYQSGLIAAKELLTMKVPSAIFAANDEMAFGVMKVASELGLAIPDDLSVVGFDGTPYSSFVNPSLSSIIRNTGKMAQIGTYKLLAMINGDKNAAEEYEIMVSPRFLPRESTGPAPGS